MNGLKTVLLLGLMSGLLLVGGEALGGRRGLIIGLVIAIGLNFFSYFFSYCWGNVEGCCFYF